MVKTERISFLVNRDSIWLNRDDATDRLFRSNIDDLVIIDLRNEGPSIRATGILQAVDEWQRKTRKPKHLIQVATGNLLEKIPYGYYTQPNLHFAQLAVKNYAVPQRNIVKSSKLFGLFLANYSSIRNCILENMLDDFKDCSLISRKTDYQPPEDPSIDYWSNYVLEQTSSIDGASPKSAWHLLDFYDQFQIEIVAETFIDGETFFPTEKIMRPIMGCKPFLVLGPMNFLKNLQAIGFKTFDKCWSESYDIDERDSRWGKIKTVLKSIRKSGYNVDLVQEIVNHNYQQLFKVASMADNHFDFVKLLRSNKWAH